MKLEAIYFKIKKIILSNNDVFTIPSNYKSELNYEEILSKKLENYESFFRENLNKIINENIQFEGKKETHILDNIISLNESINETIKLYFDGKPQKASENLFKCLNDNKVDKILLTNEIEKGKLFYRARYKADYQYEKKDLFHIPFEKRHLISTNRFSIPGTPAMYMGDNSYVCWEEFNQPNFEDLWFSVIENNRQVKVIEILRIEDFLEQNEKNENPDDYVFKLLQYLYNFPLSIACSIRTKYPNGKFKAEYILPQMLLEYVAQNEEIQGIKFPSTKIDYSKIENLTIYNYVFPVKNSKTEGMCEFLKSIFNISEPTSLKTEELLHNPSTIQIDFSHDGGYRGKEGDPKISIIKGDSKYYLNTSFGKIDLILKTKETQKL